MKHANKDFVYCQGIGCTLKERCVRYIEGLQYPREIGGGRLTVVRIVVRFCL